MSSTERKWESKPVTDEGSSIAPLTALARLNRSLTSLPFPVFAGALCLAALIKAGLLFQPLIPESELSSPGQVVYLNAGVGPNLIVTIMRLLGISTFTGYEIFAFGWTVTALVLLVIIARARLSSGEDARMFVTVILLGPTAVVLLGHFGSNDTSFIVAAIALVTFPRSWVIALASAIVLALSNPGQAMIVALCLTLVASTTRFRRYFRASAILVCVASTVLIITLLRSATVNGPSQVTYFFDDLARALEQNSHVVPLLIYSGFGATLLLIVWAIATQKRGAAIKLAISTLIVPCLMSLVWLDGTRYIVNLSIPFVIILAIEVIPSLRRLMVYRGASVALATFVLLGLVFPAVHVFGGTTRLPYEYAIERAHFYFLVLTGA